MRAGDIFHICKGKYRMLWRRWGQDMEGRYLPEMNSTKNWKTIKRGENNSMWQIKFVGWRFEVKRI